MDMGIGMTIAMAAMMVVMLGGVAWTGIRSIWKRHR
jgi:hypothetical protein